MFSNKDVIPVQDYRIDTYPSLKDLSTYTDKALQVRGMKHVYIWEDKEVHKTFKLAMLARNGVAEMEWWLHEEAVSGNRMVWFYKTKDMYLIFAQMCEAVGAPTSLHEEEIEAHREFKKNFEREKGSTGSLGDRLVKKKTRDITFGAFELDGTEPLPGSAINPGASMPGMSDPGNNMTAQSAASYSSMTTEDISTSTMDRLMGGDIKVRPIGAIIQTASQADVTGHLKVTGSPGTVVVQFGLGRPVHAYAEDGRQGTDVLLELFTWREGHASFEEGLQPESASVQESSQEIIQQGEALLENFAFLEFNKINEISVLQKPPLLLNEDKILERLQDGALLGIKVQMYFVESVDGQQTVSQIAAKANLNKSRWVGIVGNLLKLGLIHTPDGKSLNQIARKQREDPMQLPGTDAEKAFQDAVAQTSQATGPQGSSSAANRSPRKGGKAVPQPPKFLFNKAAETVTEAADGTAWPVSTGDEVSLDINSPNGFAGTDAGQAGQPGQVRKESYFGVPSALVDIDKSQAEAGRFKLCNQETGIYEFDSFQYLLTNEFARAFRFGTEFSLVLFCIKISDGADTINSDHLSAVTKTIEGITREVDYFGHFGNQAFGILLPGINCEQAVILCQRIWQDLPGKLPELARFAPSIHFGIASVPSDAKELLLLVSNAQKAMFNAVETNSQIVQASELRG